LSGQYKFFSISQLARRGAAGTAKVFENTEIHFRKYFAMGPIMYFLHMGNPIIAFRLISYGDSLFLKSAAFQHFFQKTSIQESVVLVGLLMLK
jgi:hypothetical protein